MFSRFEGEIHDRGEYVAIKTPHNPGFHWGNYLIFDAPPAMGDFGKWTETYRSEFTYYDIIRHMTFTWNEVPHRLPVVTEFLNAGFAIDRAKVLTASRVCPPPKSNRAITVRRIETEEEWDEAIHLHVLVRNPAFEKASYEKFKKLQFETYRKMCKAGLGHRFSAFLDGVMVGDLGIFHENGTGRFQNVCTHPDWRRQGICGTLVHQAALMAFQEYGVTTLVMEADADYHAAKIYESVGFIPTEENQSLNWWEANP